MTLFKQTIVELGCGTGKQLMRLATKNPTKFYIGIDSDQSAFQETLKKIKKQKLKNIEFIAASAEKLPDALTNKADQVLIYFPWGSLLESFVKVEPELTGEIKKVAKTDAELIVQLTYDEKYEGEYKNERGLPNLDFEFLSGEFKTKCANFGIEINEIKKLSKDEKSKIDSPWGKKILSKRDREVFEVRGIVRLVDK